MTQNTLIPSPMPWYVLILLDCENDWDAQALQRPVVFYSENSMFTLYLTSFIDQLRQTLHVIHAHVYQCWWTTVCGRLLVSRCSDGHFNLQIGTVPFIFSVPAAFSHPMFFNTGFKISYYVSLWFIILSLCIEQGWKVRPLFLKYWKWKNTSTKVNMW